MRFQSRYLALCCLFLGLSLACGGAPRPPGPATGLAYTDPVSAGWRLVQDASSTPTRIVLNLVGPAGLKTRGVGFNLQAPVAVRFGAFSSGLALADLGVYQLRVVGSIDPSEPVGLVGAIKSGNLLTAGIFQKDRAQGAQDSGAALCQLAIVFDATTGLKVGQEFPLSLTKAKVIPEDIGTVTDDLLTLSQKMKMADIDVAVGPLTAR